MTSNKFSPVEDYLLVWDSTKGNTLTEVIGVILKIFRNWNLNLPGTCRRFVEAVIMYLAYQH